MLCPLTKPGHPPLCVAVWDSCTSLDMMLSFPGCTLRSKTSVAIQGLPLSGSSATLHSLPLLGLGLASPGSPIHCSASWAASPAQHLHSCWVPACLLDPHLHPALCLRHTCMNVHMQGLLSCQILPR